MAEYELIIERKQPPCGSKPSKLYDFQTVTTDDPDGETEITLGEGFNEIRYIFSPQ